MMSTICSVAGCNKESVCRGWCIVHYTRWKRHRNPLTKKHSGITVKHGAASNGRHTPEYTSWHSMIQRCLNPNNPRYSDYGGRGINVCERWRKFENFLADMGTRPANKSLDRFPDNCGNYEPGNCRWATATEQQHNRRSRKRNP